MLFWTIVAVGSQRYSKDPTILSLLAPKVIELAQQAIFRRENTLLTIQALLVLCIWPMPVDTMYKDVSPVLAGAMISMAYLIGLHVPGVGKDFSRTPVREDHNDEIFRGGLWLSCVVAAQR
jgi:hypothetical protein